MGSLVSAIFELGPVARPPRGGSLMQRAIGGRRGLRFWSSVQVALLADAFVPDREGTNEPDP